MSAPDLGLRCEERGKPMRARSRDDPAGLAHGVVQHSARCGFAVMGKPRREAPATGRNAQASALMVG